MYFNKEIMKNFKFKSIASKLTILFVSLFLAASFSAKASAQFQFVSPDFDSNTINWDVFHKDIKTSFDECIQSTEKTYRCYYNFPLFLDKTETDEEKTEIKRICNEALAALYQQSMCYLNLSLVSNDETLCPIESECYQKLNDLFTSNPIVKIQKIRPSDDLELSLTFCSEIISHSYEGVPNPMHASCFAKLAVVKEDITICYKSRLSEDCKIQFHSSLLRDQYKENNLKELESICNNKSSYNCFYLLLSSCKDVNSNCNKTISNVFSNEIAEALSKTSNNWKNITYKELLSYCPSQPECFSLFKYYSELKNFYEQLPFYSTKEFPVTTLDPTHAKYEPGLEGYTIEDLTDNERIIKNEYCDEDRSCFDYFTENLGKPNTQYLVGDFVKCESKISYDEIGQCILETQNDILKKNEQLNKTTFENIRFSCHQMNDFKLAGNWIDYTKGYSNKCLIKLSAHQKDIKVCDFDNAYTMECYKAVLSEIEIDAREGYCKQINNEYQQRICLKSIERVAEAKEATTYGVSNIIFIILYIIIAIVLIMLQLRIETEEVKRKSLIDLLVIVLIFLALGHIGLALPLRPDYLIAISQGLRVLFGPTMVLSFMLSGILENLPTFLIPLTLDLIFIGLYMIIMALLPIRRSIRNVLAILLLIGLSLLATFIILPIIAAILIGT